MQQKIVRTQKRGEVKVIYFTIERDNRKELLDGKSLHDEHLLHAWCMKVRGCLCCFEHPMNL
jgi:hypothetical protein